MVPNANIIKKEQETQYINQDEIQLLGDYQSFTKPDNWEVMISYITKQDPPTTNKGYLKIPYRHFNDLAKLMYRYKTYYPEIYISPMKTPKSRPVRHVRRNAEGKYS